MSEQLLQLDRHLFYLINHAWGNPFFDFLMPLLRNPKFWIPLYVFIFAFSLIRYKKQGIVLLLLLGVTFGVADFVSASIIKKEVQRIRPCNDPELSSTIVSRVPCGSGFSFPSSHASNHFAIALFLSVAFYKKWRWIWLVAVLWAVSICYAQVYVGVHYPIDVTAGALFGALVGLLFGLLFKRFTPNF